MENTTGTAGSNIRSVRKRRGLSQRELAELAGFSTVWVKRIEQGTADPPVETLGRLARVLKVTTTRLLAGTEPAKDAPHAPQMDDDWADVLEALYGHTPPPDGEVTPEGVLSVVTAVRPALAANRFTEVRAVLPRLIRDAAALDGEGRHAQSRVLNLTGWLLTQTRQWDAAETAVLMAADAGAGTLDASSALNTWCWLLLRQGELSRARVMAAAEAAKIEPKFSTAEPRELAMWGRLLLGVTNAAIRDNRPGEAEDALSLARAAAGRIGREVCLDGSTARTFGPVSTMMILAENAAIERRPDKVLSIAEGIPKIAEGLGAGMLHPASASRRRHRLDIANAHVMLRRYPEAMGILRQLRAEAPEWLVQQAYARQVVKDILEQRRSLTIEMRDLADAVGLPL
jgi:transcriptional regulator with XRE-family HTH domain